jgi:excisionase family DNA binding protein
VLSRSQVAERLGVSLRTVERLQASGELPYLKVRRRVVFEAAEVEKFVRKAKARTARQGAA